MKKESTSNNKTVQIISFSVILGILIIGLFYSSVQSKNVDLERELMLVEVEREKAENLQAEKDAEIQRQEGQEMQRQRELATKRQEAEDEENEWMSKKKEQCDQLYDYLSNKYNNIISVTYFTEPHNECMISVPDEAGKQVWVKSSTHVYD